MNKSIFTGLLISLPVIIWAQSKTIADFGSRHGDNLNATTVNISGSFFNIIMQIANGLDNDPDLQAIGKLAGNIDQLKVIKVPFSKTGADVNDIEDLITGLKSEGFDEFASFREGREHLRVFARYDRKAIKEAVIVADEYHHLSVVSIEGNLTGDDIASLIRNLKH